MNTRPGYNEATTEHRCVDGKWHPGRTRHCEACHDAGRKKPFKAKGRLES